MQGTVIQNFGRAKDLSDDEFPIATGNQLLWATEEEWANISRRRPNMERVDVVKGKSQQNRENIIFIQLVAS
jgi:hypothetical protein